MKKRIALALAMAICLSLLCTVALADKVTVNFFHRWPNEPKNSYINSLIDEFEAANPDIDIVADCVLNDSYKEKIRVLVSTDALPDVFFSWSGVFGENLTRSGRVLALDDVMARDSEWSSQIVEGQWAPFNYNGKQYGAPWSMDGKAFFYNVDVFNELGIEVPTTMDELIEVCKTLKEAGYDACVVRGKAEAPVWISVVNDQVTFNDATDLWGLDTFECQERIWDEVTHGTAPGSWYELTKGRDGGRTTQRPSVICIGPAGENLARVSCIVHDAGHVTGQSGFGAVFGAKNLKAMSFIGSKSIPIADPAALVRLRLEVQEKFGYDIDACKVPGAPGSPGAAATVLDTSPTVSRAEGCRGCFKNCRNLYPGGVGNELTCSAGLYFTDSGKIDEQLAAYSLLSKLGLNGYEIDMPVYLHNLYKMGVMGKGKDIDTDLPFEQYARTHS